MTSYARVAKNADDAVMNLHEGFGSVTRELGVVQIALGSLRGAVDDLGKQVERIARRLDGRASKHDLEEVKEDLEDSKVQNLRALLAASQAETATERASSSPCSRSSAP